MFLSEYRCFIPSVSLPIDANVLLLCRLAVIIEIGIDLIIDAPKIWKYLADLLGKYLRQLFLGGKCALLLNMSNKNEKGGWEQYRIGPCIADS